MIYSFQKYLTPLIAGSLIFSLNACSSFLTRQTSNNDSVVSENKPSQTTNENSDHNIVKLTFGVYTADKPTTVVKEFRPILNVLEKKMSEIMQKPVKIKMAVANSYEKGIQDIVKGEVDFSLLGLLLM